MQNTILDPALLATRSESRAVSVNSVFNFVYGWMTMGLVISGAIAWWVAQAAAAGAFPLSRGTMLGCMVVEVILVLVISAAIERLAPIVAALLFALFSAVNGVSLSVIFLAFEMTTIQTTFFITAGMFAGMALFGTLTKKNLAGVGSFCLMGLWGLILASLVNLFLKSSGLDFAISIIGVLIFTGLTAYDAQKVRLLAETTHMDKPMRFKLGLLCALELYLDFVNLFLYLLRFFGKGRD